MADDTSTSLEETGEEPTDVSENRFEYAQAIRTNFINAMTANDGIKMLALDPKLGPVLLKALKDMDSLELGRKRLNLDQEQGSKAIAVHEAYLALQSKVGNKDPFLSNQVTTLRNNADTDLPDIAVSDGELEIESSRNMDSRSFVEQYEKNRGDPSSSSTD